MFNVSSSEITSQLCCSPTSSSTTDQKIHHINTGRVLPTKHNPSQSLYLLIIEDAKNQRLIYLDCDLYNLGRSTDNSIIIYDGQVSRYHATITKEYNEDKKIFFYQIWDGNLQGKRSSNGVYINGKKFFKKYLEHGDLIRFSDTAKARYFVIDRNSKLIDIFKNINPQNKEDKTSNKKDDNKITLNANQDFWKEIDRDQYNYLSRLASFSELSPYPIIELNLKGKITYCNPAALLKFKELPQQKLAHPVLIDLLKSKDKIQGSLFVREVIIDEQVFEQYIHYLPELQLIRSYIFDFTERKQIEAKLRDSEAKYRAVVQQTSEGIFLVDANSKQIIEANPAASKLLNYSLSELTNFKIGHFLVNDDDILNEYLSKSKHIKDNLSIELEFYTKQKNKIDVEISANLINYHNQEMFCFVFRDITKRKQLEAELKYNASHDILTGLSNRNLFNEYLSKALATAKRNNIFMAVMFLDLDHFKYINDNYGHDVGDELLKEFAQRLQACLRYEDTIARWGGDEFTILLPQIDSKNNVMKIVQRIDHSLQKHFQINQYKIQVQTSIGIALYPQDGNKIEILLKKADIALYWAKERGRNNSLFYSDNYNNG